MCPEHNLIKFETELSHLLVIWLWQVTKIQLNHLLAL